MSNISISGATNASAINPNALQAARIAARVSVSAAVADVMARHAFGADRRDHGAMLVEVMTSRIGAAEEIAR